MKRLFTYYAIILFIGLCTPFMLSSCGDKNKDDAEPKGSGIIEGSVNPVESVTEVKITNERGRNFTTVPDATGKFVFRDLATGNYELSFSVTSDYITPIPQSFYVLDNYPTDLGEVLMSLRPGVGSGTIKGTMNWVTSDGKTYSASTYRGVIDEKGIDIIAFAVNGTTVHELRLNQGYAGYQGGFKGIGTYDIAGRSNSSGFAHFARYVNDIQEIFYNTQAFYVNPAGTLVITSFDTRARSISGTFEFEALTNSTNLQAIQVEGSFNLTF